MKSIVVVFAMTASLAMLVSGALGRTWYIKPDSTGDAPTIQAGIDLAANGDTVLLAAGCPFH